MFGKKIVMTSLQTRKQLLIAESEINRELLARELRGVAEGMKSLTLEVGRYGSIFASVSALAAVVSVFRKSKPAPPEKTGWFSFVTKAVRVGLTLWPMLSAKRRTSAPSQAPVNA